MIRCLIVDDDPVKVSQIESVVKLEFGDGGVEITIVGAAYDAGAQMRASMFDLSLIHI